MHTHGHKIFNLDLSLYCKISLSWAKEQTYKACPKSYEKYSVYNIIKLKHISYTPQDYSIKLVS